MTVPAIDLIYLKKVLRDLLRIPSPTGYTDQIVHFVSDELKCLGISHELTRRGAIRAIIRGQNSIPARSVIAHLDTLGAQVKALKDNGRLHLVPIGHWSSRFAEGARTIIYTRTGSHTGTILPLKASGHTYNKEVDTQPTDWDHVELRVDEQVTDRPDLERHGFAVGDFVAIHPQPEFLENGYIVSRHLDDKGGVAAMMAAMKALVKADERPPVDCYFLFSIAEEVGVGASSVLHGDVASMVTIDNGTTAPGQNSREFGVTIAMADSVGPFDYHLTHKLIDLAEDHDIPYQRDVFRYYRCDSASALEAGNDIRTALITFGLDASHGYERIHEHALESVARLTLCYILSPVNVPRDARAMAPIEGFTHQPVEPADHASGGLIKKRKSQAKQT